MNTISVVGAGLRTAPAKRQLIAALCLLAVLFISAPIARAQDGEPEEPPTADEITDDEVNTIAERLYCPVCENVPLDVCGTQACADWRDEIRAMLAEGRSREEIENYFSERYGRRVLATPDPRGIDALVWVLPPLGVIVGIVVLVFALRRMAPGALSVGAEAKITINYDDLDPDYVAQLERELEEFTS